MAGDFVKLSPAGMWHGVYEPLGPKLLSFWSLPVSLSDDFRLKDLFNWLKSGDAADLTLLELLTDCNIAPFLDDVVAATDNCRSTATTIQVQKIVALGHKKKVSIVTQTYGLDAEGNAMSILFSPVAALADLPIRLAPYALLRDYDFATQNVLMTITLGEFLTSVFNALCFFGSPVEQSDAVNSVLAKVEP